MTKFEFLGDLSRLIADLPEEDREQAMEYYEDYFADAGPEKEQEIIKDFISPAYIAEQLRKASAQRQKAANTQSIPQQTTQQQTVPQQTAPQQTVPQRTTIQQTASVNTTVSHTSQPAQQTIQNPAVSASQQTQPFSETPTETVTPPAVEKEKVSVAAHATPSDVSASAMRNPIFQQNSAENISKEEEEALALKKKTKVDIKSINAATSKIGKKQAKAAAKQSALEDREYAATLYSGPKKAIIIALLIITCPITLSILGIIIGLFLVAIGFVIGFVLLGVAAFAVSIISLLLSILSLLTAHIPNCIFALGSALLLFSAGIGICYMDFKLFTRVIPSAYFNIMILFNNIKAALGRFAMK